VTQIGKIGITRQCGVCGRTLLLGEQVEDFTNGVRRVSVCTLCLSEATARGWLRAGAPAPPPVEQDSPEAGEKRGWLRRRRGPAVVEEPEPEPDRSLPVPAARALERRVDAFDASAYRRTVASLAEAFGVPRRAVSYRRMARVACSISRLPYARSRSTSGSTASSNEVCRSRVAFAGSGVARASTFVIQTGIQSS